MSWKVDVADLVVIVNRGLRCEGQILVRKAWDFSVPWLNGRKSWSGFVLKVQLSTGSSSKFWVLIPGSGSLTLFVVFLVTELGLVSTVSKSSLSSSTSDKTENRFGWTELVGRARNFSPTTAPVGSLASGVWVRVLRAIFTQVSNVATPLLKHRL